MSEANHSMRPEGSAVEKVYLGVMVGPHGGSAASYDSHSYKRKAEPLKRVGFRVVNNFQVDYEAMRAACEEAAIIKAIGGEAVRRTIGAVGVGLPGQLVPERTKIKLAGSLTDWIGREVEYKLKNDLECPVALGNDAEAAALSEIVHGTAPAFGFSYIIWDIGVSGCEVLRDGEKPFLIPSELGHQIIDPTATETRCGCDNPGCLESFVGRWSLERFDRPLDDLLPSQQEEIVKRMTIGMHNTQRIISVPNITIGGSLATLYQGLLPDIKQRLQRMLGMTKSSELIIRLASADATAGNLGAHALIGQFLEESVEKG